jgi:WD40 repeat protein
MTAQQSPWRIVLLVTAWLGACLLTPASAVAQPVPEDFKMVARYGPGFSDWRSWTTSITGDGKALQKVGTGGRGGGEPSEKTASLSKDDLAALVSRVKEADFFKLKGKYRGRATDQATLTLEVTLGKKTHQVSVYGFRFIRDKEEQDEVDRFLRVWVELLKKVPSPNPELLDLYKAGGGGKKKPTPPSQQSEMQATLRGHTGSVSSVAFTPDAKTLASAGYDKTIKLWDVKAGKEQATLQGHTGSVSSVAFSPDGKTLASLSEGEAVKLWDVAGRKNTANLLGPQKYVRSVAFSPDGKTLATGGSDPTVQLWDMATGKKGVAFESDLAAWSVAFSPVGKTIAAGGHHLTGWAGLWDVASGKHARLPFGQIQGVHSVAFSPDGNTLAASHDMTVKVWDVATAKRSTLQGHTQAVMSVAFSPDGRTLASASNDKTIKL